MWQDVVISVGQWAMTAALIPSLIGKDKPAVSSGIMTGTLIAIFGFTYGTLGLWSAVISSAVCSIVWYVLAWQRYRMNRRERMLE